MFVKGKQRNEKDTKLSSPKELICGGDDWSVMVLGSSGLTIERKY